MTALVTAFLLAVATAPAYADNIKNDISASGQTSLTLSHGSATSTIGFFVQTGNGNACAVDAAHPAVYNVVLGTPGTASVTASPSQLTFNDCTTHKQVTFTATSAGTRTVSLSFVSGLSGLNASPAGFAFTISGPANTPPTVAVGGVANGASYEFGAVPAAGCSVTDPDETSPSATPQLSAITGPLASFGLGSRTVTCSYTDSAGATASATATYSIVDTTKPTLNTPGDQVLEATSPSGATATWTVSGSDNVALASATCTPASPQTYNLGPHTVSCTATDVAGNTRTGSFTVTVRDTTSPTLVVGNDVTREASGPTGATATYPAATATDTHDGALTPTCAPPSGSTFALGNTPVTCSVADASGNGASGTLTVHVIDTTGPGITVPADQTLEATGPAGAPYSFSATATDLVDGSRPVSCSTSPAGATYGFGTTTVTCSATDTRGNTTFRSFSVTVRDTTKPVLHVPADLSVEATGPGGAPVSYTAGATDTADDDVPADCIPASGTTLGIGTHDVNCTAVDDHGNTAQQTFHVTVRDTAPPELTAPGDQSLEATSPAGAVATWTAPTASDVVDGTRPVTCNHASGDTFPLGATTVTCSTQDTRSNGTSTSFVVTVSDSTPPTLTVPSHPSAEAGGPTGAVVSYTEPSATDVASASVDVVCNHHSGDLFAVDDTAVSCTATDAQGLTTHKTFTVTVRDTTPPTVHVPAGFDVEAAGPLGAVATYDATATDLVDGALGATCDVPSGSFFLLDVPTYVTCSATDAHSNSAQATFVVTVTDTKAPVLVVPVGFTLEATGAGGATADFESAASDVVDGPVTPVCTPPSGSLFVLGTTEVECDATDSHHNGTGASFDVTVVDTTPPSLHVPADITAEAEDAGGAAVPFTVTSTDTVDGAVVPDCSAESGDTFALGTTTVSCSATDARGNTSGLQTFTVTVQDTTPPNVSVPDATVVEADQHEGAMPTWTATATDRVDGVLAPLCVPASGGLFGFGETAVTCSATDAAGNTGSASFSITVVDTTRPDVHVPADASEEATGPDGATVSFDDASASDVVDGTVPTTCDAASGETFPVGDTLVTCTATDAHRNTGSANFHVVVTDHTPPHVTVPDSHDVEATGPDGAHPTWSATASDLVDGSVPTTCVPSSGSLFDLGSSDVTCSATDAHGNTGHAAFSLAVVDTTPPAVTAPGDQTIEATGPDGAVASFDTGSAQDIVDGALTPECDRASGTTFPLGDTVVHCSATDAHHNTGLASFTITVQDTTAPVLSPPANFDLEAEGPQGAVASYTAAANDVVDGALPASCTPASGSTFALDQHTLVDCSAKDAAGNTGHAAFTIYVQDTTSPVLVVPTQVTEEATSPDGADVSYAASATDLVDGSVTPVCAPPSDSTFQVGDTTVDCTATDVHHNQSAASFPVHVVDTTPPVVTVDHDATIEATGPQGAAYSWTASATDTVDVSTPVGCDATSGDTFPLGHHTVTCTSTDAHDNTGTTSFGFDVVDTTAPDLVLPSDKTVEATGPDGAETTWTTFAGDIVDGLRAVSCTPDDHHTFTLGETTVTCSASDTRGNTATDMFTVTVEDTTGPELSLPHDRVIEATSPAGASTGWTTSASDLVDGDRPVACTPDSGSTFALGQTTVHCSSADTRDNASTGSFTVTVEDTTGPALHLPGDKTLEATGPDGAPLTYAATATDAVDVTDVVTCDHPSGSTFALGTTTVTCTATDVHLNSARASFEVTVRDTTAPVVTPPTDIDLEAAGPGGAVATFTASATDVVDGTLVTTCTPASGETFPLDAHTVVTCTATDAHDNTGSASFTVFVHDLTAPALVVPAPITREATGPSGATATFTTSASDVVDGPLPTSCSPASGSTFPLGDTTVGCSATDAHHNTGSASFGVKVVDTTAPALTVPSGLHLEATGAGGASAAWIMSASDLVDGTVVPTCDHAVGATYPLGSTTVTCSATDAHHNTATQSFAVEVVDTTGPSVTVPANKVVEATGTSGAAASWTATATDLVDGSRPVSCTPASGTTFALGTTTVTCTATDTRGNPGSAGFTVTVRDTTAPTLTLPANITTTATSPAGRAVAFTASASDAVSGNRPVTCTPTSGSVFTPGPTTVPCSATDAAGNTASASFTVTVGFTWNGFFAPVDNSGVVNTIKGGQTVPIKWALPNGSGGWIGDLAVVSGVHQTTVTCGNAVVTDDIEAPTTGGTVLRYDATANQYIYNWQTPKTTGICYQVSVRLTDGSSHTALFKTK